MDDLLADFLTETNEGLAELDSALVKLERNPGDEAMLSLIFAMHFSKSSTAAPRATEPMLSGLRFGRGT